MEIKEYNKAFAKRLKYYLDRDNMNQSELAKRLHVSPQAVTNWIRGEKTPRMDKVDAMCDIFGCRRSDFSDDVYMYSSNRSSTSLPLYGSVCAGDGIFADDNIEEWIDVGNGRYSKETHFMLRVKGNSMEPDIKDGDIVIARKQDVADDGDVVIAIVNGDEGVCKRLKTYQEGMALISINPAYEPRFFSEEEVTGIPVRIVGKVVELKRVY